MDDDITFEKNYLEKINNLINKKKHDIITYAVFDKYNKPFLKYPKKNCYLKSLRQIFNSISSVSFVINSKNRLFFDKKIGLGSKDIYQSGEETDFIIRSMRKFNYKIYYDNSIKVFNEEKKISFTNLIKKKFYYGCGWGYVVRKNNLDLFFIINSILKITLNAVYHLFSFNIKKFILSLITILGRLYGFIK